MHNRPQTEGRDKITRRRVLSTSVGAVATVGGLGAFAETASAWQWYEVEFEECSEVHVVVGEDDLEYEPPLLVDVIVASWGDNSCRTVEITADNATTDHDQCGDDPVITYEASGAEKILGVVHYTPARAPICLTVNNNECTQMAVDPDASDADCVPDDLEECDHSRETRCHGASSGRVPENPFVQPDSSRLRSLRRSLTRFVGRRNS